MFYPITCHNINSVRLDDVNIVLNMVILNKTLTFHYIFRLTMQLKMHVEIIMEAVHIYVFAHHMVIRVSAQQGHYYKLTARPVISSLMHIYCLLLNPVFLESRWTLKIVGMCLFQYLEYKMPQQLTSIGTRVCWFIQMLRWI